MAGNLGFANACVGLLGPTEVPCAGIIISSDRTFTGLPLNPEPCAGLLLGHMVYAGVLSPCPGKKYGMI